MRQAARVVEEAQPEGEVEGERDEHRVGRDLEDPVAVDGVVQPAHETRASLVGCSAPLAYDPPLSACRSSSSPASPTTSLDPIVDFATDFIGSAGLPAVFLLMTLESRLHPDPERGDHAVRRLQRLRRAN